MEKDTKHSHKLYSELQKTCEIWNNFSQVDTIKVKCAYYKHLTSVRGKSMENLSLHMCTKLGHIPICRSDKSSVMSQHDSHMTTISGNYFPSTSE